VTYLAIDSLLVRSGYPHPTHHHRAISPLTPLSQTLLSAKRRKGVSFAELEPLLHRDEVWIASFLYGQATASPVEALPGSGAPNRSID
jgi:hypothetical protein